jgi:hypothetical protein
MNWWVVGRNRGWGAQAASLGYNHEELLDALDIESKKIKT